MVLSPPSKLDPWWGQAFSMANDPSDSIMTTTDFMPAGKATRRRIPGASKSVLSTKSRATGRYDATGAVVVVGTSGTDGEVVDG